MVCIGGPRETLQLLGDVVVSEEDIYGERDFPDACVPATWGIDLHYPHSGCWTMPAGSDK